MINKIKNLFKSKREKLEELLEQIAPLYIKAQDCDDEIVIMFGLDEKFMQDLQKLLQKGVKLRKEDIKQAKEDFKAYVQDLLDCPNENLPKDLLDKPKELEAWIVKNDSRALQIQKIIKILEEYFQSSLAQKP
ncbi:hypothetical protein [Helicobacter burdigaliensis]|uniref:hypothetical protein n=1 Tax=Helicobacter burdigaliensis TaxID=2315334 RepID=UPI000EF708C1|nr:hypothetical protein [Helicobacter burdigaliensis]